MAMTSSRPYIVRALYEWILENDCTPYVLVNAMADRVQVPQQFVKNGQIVLNISPLAIMDLLVENEAVSFNGRFAGVPMEIYVPIGAVMGIYAKENGQGMMFDIEETNPEPPPPPKKSFKPKAVESNQSPKRPSDSKGGLRVVK